MPCKLKLVLYLNKPLESATNILVSVLPNIGDIPNDPVIDTLPVNWCVLDKVEPNLVDPVTKSVDDVIVWATIV